MENLTLEELKILLEWHNIFIEMRPSGYNTSDAELLNKLLQAIDDKELTKNDLDF